MLLRGHAARTPQGGVATFREVNNEVINWVHAEGFTIRSTVSQPLLLRATHPRLVFTINDVADLLWAED